MKLRGIGEYLTMPFRSHGRYTALTLCVSEKRFTVAFTIDFTQRAPEIFAFANVDENADEERLMREFVASRGLKLPDANWTPTTPTFVAGVPVQIIFQISPLPADAGAASMLIEELFRKVCGLNDDSELTFHYCEIANVPDVGLTG